MQVKTEVDIQKVVDEINREHHLGMRVIRFTEDCDPEEFFILHKGLFQEKPWVFLPRHWDNSEIPYEVERRVSILSEWVDEIPGQWVGHPEPEFLPEEGEEEERDIDKLGPKIIAGLMVTALIVGVVMIAAALLMVIIPFLIGIAAVAAGLFVGVDPSLICAVQTAEGFAYIEVGRWN